MCIRDRIDAIQKKKNITISKKEFLYIKYIIKWKIFKFNCNNERTYLLIYIIIRFSKKEK